MSWLPTAEQQERIDAHWADVRAGVYKNEPEPDWKTDKSAIECHRYQASLFIERAAFHARQAIELAQT